jgi:hypothetical protein
LDDEVRMRRKRIDVLKKELKTTKEALQVTKEELGGIKKLQDQTINQNLLTTVKQLTAVVDATLS